MITRLRDGIRNLRTSLIESPKPNPIPKSYREAAQSEVWRQAMDEALIDQHTWSLVPLPVGHNLIDTKWVYKVGRVAHLLGNSRIQTQNVGCYATMVHAQNFSQNTRMWDNSTTGDRSGNEDSGDARKCQSAYTPSRKEKIQILVNTLSDLKDSKEAVYGTLDSYVAWEQNFPIASLKVALVAMEKDEQWHRIVQVIKWMLSKGQGTTMGTYQQLIKALDMDNRPEEAHNFWMKRIGGDLHSVPWQMCKLMISIYHRNNMLERLIKLFKGLEAFERKPQEKAVVRKVAKAYESLGLHAEKERVLEKYIDLFTKKEGNPRRSDKKKKKPGKAASISHEPSNKKSDDEIVQHE